MIEAVRIVDKLKQQVGTISLLLCIVVIAGGGGANLFSFLTEQTDRGLQVEAPLALPYVWGAMTHVPGISVMFNYEIITFQVTGPGADVISAASVPMLVIAAGAIAWIGFSRSRAGVPMTRLLPPIALAMVLAFIVTNKVGSPQFQTWLVAPVVLWLLWDRRTAQRVALGVLAAALLTHVIYPMIYDQVLATTPLAVIVLTTRNVLLIWLLIHAIRHALALRPVHVPAAVSS